MFKMEKCGELGFLLPLQQSGEQRGRVRAVLEVIVLSSWPVVAAPASFPRASPKQAAPGGGPHERRQPLQAQPPLPTAQHQPTQHTGKTLASCLRVLLPHHIPGVT